MKTMTQSQENETVTKPFYRKKLFYAFLFFVFVLLVGGIVAAVLFGTHTLPPTAVSIYYRYYHDNCRFHLLKKCTCILLEKRT